MKNSYYGLLFSLLCVGFIFSCTPKYTASFNNSSNYIKPETKNSTLKETSEVAKVKSDNAASQVPMEEAPSANRMLVSADKSKVAPVLQDIEKLADKHLERVARIEESKLESKEKHKEIKKEEKRAKKEIRKKLKKEIKEIKKTSAEPSYALAMIFAILIPPLGVGLTYGISGEFWLSLILTLIFWLPGAIYSAIVVHNYYR